MLLKQFILFCPLIFSLLSVILINNIKNKIYKFILLKFSLLIIFISLIDITIFFITGESINKAFLFHLFYMGELEGKNILFNGVLKFLFILSIGFIFLKYLLKIKLKFSIINSYSKFLIPFLIINSYIFSSPVHEVYKYLIFKTEPSSILKNESLFIEDKSKDLNNNAPNLVFIFLESFETSFFNTKRDKFKYIHEIEQNSISFKNIYQLKDSSWTIAGMVSSLCGIPLTHPSGGNTLGNIKHFYPGAKCLGDFLSTHDYETSFIQGSNLDFSGIRQFYEQHGFMNLKGKKYFEKKFPNLETHEWGYYDNTVLNEAYDTLTNNNENKKAVFISTIDTHFPNGFVSKECIDDKNLNLNAINFDYKIESAVACTSFLVRNFIYKIRNNNKLNNTIIVLASDHISQSPPKEFLKNSERKNLFIINLPNNISKSIEKPGTQLDIASTVLNVMGFDKSIGLGVNLLGNSFSIYEKYDAESYIDSQKSKLLNLWEFPSSKNDIIFKNSNLIINQKKYSFPVLFKINNKGLMEPYYKDDASSLIRKISKFDIATTYLMIDKCEQMNYVFNNKHFNSGHCYALGKTGSKTSVKKLKSGDVISLSEIEKIKSENISSQTYKKNQKKLKAAGLLTSQQRWLIENTPKNSYIYLDEEMVLLESKDLIKSTIESYYPVQVLFEHPLDKIFYKLRKKIYKNIDSYAYELNEITRYKKLNNKTLLIKIKIWFKSLLKKIYDDYWDEDLYYIAVKTTPNKKILSSNETEDLNNRNLPNIFIAHAGGEIDGYIYTNTLEALNKSYNAGLRLFELDLIETKDGNIVASHDWEMWKNNTKFNGQIPPSIDDFKKYKLHEKYTPLTINEISKWFSEHNDAILVTDKINSPNKLLDLFPFKDRLVMELFTEEALLEADALQIQAMPSWQLIVSSSLSINDLLIKKIKYIAISKSEVIKNLPYLLSAKENGIKVYIFNINDKNYKNSEQDTICSFQDLVHGFYVDNVNLNIKKCN